MKLLSRLAGFRCVRCGALLPFFATSNAEAGRSVDCSSCGASMHLERAESGRLLQYVLGRLPEVAYGIAVLFAIIWLNGEPPKSPQLIGVVVLVFLLSIPLTLFVSEAIRHRIGARVAGRGR